MEKPLVELSSGQECLEYFFMTLLSQSLSLDKKEKISILQKLNGLIDIQIVQLIDVYVEEQQRFSEMVLKDDYEDEVRSLVEQADEDWQFISWLFEFESMPLLDVCLLDALIHIWQRDIAPHIKNKDEYELIKFVHSDFYEKWLNELQKWMQAQNNKTHGECLDYFAKINVKSGRISRKVNQDELINFCGKANKTALSALMSLKNNHGGDDCFDKSQNNEANTNLADGDLEDSKLFKKNETQNSTTTTHHLDRPVYKKSLKMLKPNIAIENLSNIIFGQDDAVKKLVLAMYYHKKFQQQFILGGASFQRQMPILLLGDTGWGKTHIAKTIAEYYDAKLTIVNCASMVSTGIVGMSVDNIGKMIIDAHQTVDESEFAIVFLDEFDKLFISDKADMPKVDIISQLLSVIEGMTPLGIEYKYGQFKEDVPMSIDTSKMLFILAGSFNIHKKNKKGSIGFHRKNDNQAQGQLALGDLGVPDELAGRIGRVITLNPLKDEDYLAILYHSPTSPWVVLKNQVAMMGCRVEMDEHIVTHLIKQNKESIEKFGARGLYQAFQKLNCIDDILLDATKDEDGENECKPFKIVLDENI